MLITRIKLVEVAVERCTAVQPAVVAANKGSRCACGKLKYAARRSRVDDFTTTSSMVVRLTISSHGDQKTFCVVRSYSGEWETLPRRWLRPRERGALEREQRPASCTVPRRQKVQKNVQFELF